MRMSNIEIKLNEPKSSALKRILLSIGILVLIAAAAFGYLFYSNALSPNTPKEIEKNVLLVPTGATIESIIDSLNQNRQIVNEKRFRWTARRMGFDETSIKRGRYIISPLASNRKIISILRGGNQTPLNVTIQNVRTIEQLAGRVEGKFEFDSVQLMEFIDFKFDSMAGTKKETRLTRFLPNTYEFYWTASPEDFCSRMLKEHEKFWTEERKAKAASIGLTTDEVYTLASIIEKETNHNPEKERMAGVYLNRLRDSIPLAADPTIVFAIGDFELRRVLWDHLQIESPYNTYKYPGLPPGPIFMPGIPSIDAVLNREVHDYFYFCARPTEDGPGHAFASTFQAHIQNANRYRDWLNKRGIN